MITYDFTHKQHTVAFHIFLLTLFDILKIIFSTKKNKTEKKIDICGVSLTLKKIMNIIRFIFYIYRNCVI